MSVASEYLQLQRESTEEMVRRHAPLVRRIAYHLMGRLPPSVDVDDLVQAGMIGLLEAARNYATDRMASFETYAGIRIRGAMLDELRKTDWTPRSVHRKLREVSEVVRQIENETGADATDAEVIRRLGIDAQEYHQILADAASARLLSLSAPEDDEEGAALAASARIWWYSCASMPRRRITSASVASAPVSFSIWRTTSDTSRNLRCTERGVQSVLRSSSSMAPRIRMPA